MALIDPGKKAPAFSLKDQDGKTHKLADYAGQPVVLYFYPKDDTPGCTKESCEFRDNLPHFKKSNAGIFGMSILEEKEQKKFADKFDLKFPLLADADHDVAEEFRLVGREVTHGRQSWAREDTYLTARRKVARDGPREAMARREVLRGKQPKGPGNGRPRETRTRV